LILFASCFASFRVQFDHGIGDKGGCWQAFSGGQGEDEICKLFAVEALNRLKFANCLQLAFPFPMAEISNLSGRFIPFPNLDSASCKFAICLPPLTQ